MMTTSLLTQIKKQTCNRLVRILLFVNIDTFIALVLSGSAIGNLLQYNYSIIKAKLLFVMNTREEGK